MIAQAYTEYECFDPVSDMGMTTRDRFVALDRFENGWMVFEHHIAVTAPSPFVSTREDVVLRWNNNPYLEALK